MITDTKAGQTNYQQGRLLLTNNTKLWSKAQRDEADEQEHCMVFTGFAAEDEGRSRNFVCKCNSPYDAATLVQKLNSIEDQARRIEELEQQNTLLSGVFSREEELKKTIEDLERRERMLVEFQEGQWWVKELDSIPRKNLSDDAYRAIAVVHRLLKIINATPAETAEHELARHVEWMNTLPIVATKYDSDAERTRYSTEDYTRILNLPAHTQLVAIPTLPESKP